MKFISAEKYLIQTVRTLLVWTMLGSLVACGGGSGDDTAPDEPSPFVDPNSAAELTAENAAGIAGLVSQSLFGGFLVGYSAGIIFEEVPLSSGIQRVGPKAVLPVSAACPGGGVISASWSDAAPSGELSVDDRSLLMYDNCLISDYQFGGVATLVVDQLQGEQGVDTNWSVAARVSFASPTSNMLATAEGETIEIGGGGSVTFDHQGATRIVSVSANPLIQFAEAEGYLTNLEPFGVSLSHVGDDFQFSGSGTVSANYAGRLAFLITQTLGGTNFFANRPSRGEIRITGADNKTIWIRVVDETQVSLDFDSDGDGNSDQTIPLTWDAMFQAAENF